jgi:hypothetical protein
MSGVNKNDIETLLFCWYKTKKDIALFESKLEKYKKLATKIMIKQDIDTLESTYHTLTRRELSRQTIGKRDVPKDVWDKYSKQCSYSAYYIKENKVKNK